MKTCLKIILIEKMKSNKLLAGDYVSEFLLLKKVDTKGNWEVRCKCGHEYIARVHALKNQNNCRKCNQTSSNHHSWKGFGEISHDLYTTIKHSASAKNLEFNVSIEYLWKLFLKQERKCTFTGEEIKFNKTFKGKKEKTASLDRVDSSIGYVEGNLQWVHRDVNKLKKNFTDERFIEICKKVAIYK